MSGPSPIWVIIVVAGAYLLGAVPFGWLIARARGVDLFAVGSGNIGATNVGRVLGKRLGIATFVLDVLKGMVPVLLAPIIWDRAGGASPELGTAHYVAWLAVAAAAILGHMFPIYLRFRGGKGVATSLGVLLGVWPYFSVPALVCFGVWLVVFLTTRYVSLGSVVAAALFPVVYLAIGVWRDWAPLGRQWPLLMFSLIMAALVVIRHRANLQRLLAGQEHRFDTKPTSSMERTG